VIITRTVYNVKYLNDTNSHTTGMNQLKIKDVPSISK